MHASPSNKSRKHVVHATVAVAQEQEVYSCGREDCLNQGVADAYNAVTRRPEPMFVLRAGLPAELATFGRKQLAPLIRCHDCGRREEALNRQVQKLSAVLEMMARASRKAAAAERDVAVGDYVASYDRARTGCLETGESAPILPIERKAGDKLACGLPGDVPCCDKHGVAHAFHVVKSGKQRIVVGLCPTATGHFKARSVPCTREYAKAEAYALPPEVRVTQATPVKVAQPLPAEFLYPPPRRESDGPVREYTDDVRARREAKRLKHDQNLAKRQAEQKALDALKPSGGGGGGKGRKGRH